jgi:uncharacterized membrane protein YadS
LRELQAVAPLLVVVQAGRTRRGTAEGKAVVRRLVRVMMILRDFIMIMLGITDSCCRMLVGKKANAGQGEKRNRRGKSAAFT